MVTKRKAVTPEWQPTPKSPAAIRQQRYRDRIKERERARRDAFWRERYAELEARKAGGGSV